MPNVPPHKTPTESQLGHAKAPNGRSFFFGGGGSSHDKKPGHGTPASSNGHGHEEEEEGEMKRERNGRVEREMVRLEGSVEDVTEPFQI